ncbi:MAG: hypothetical protein EOO46_03690 [Flavobacterium sp.]|nr:MAG: hypothetical protein EOO46_03690 [Flavobacterium sp.]
MLALPYIRSESFGICSIHNPALRCNLFLFKEKRKRISTPIGAAGEDLKKGKGFPLQSGLQGRTSGILGIFFPVLRPGKRLPSTGKYPNSQILSPWTLRFPIPKCRHLQFPLKNFRLQITRFQRLEKKIKKKWL